MQTTATATVSASGTYTVAVTGANGCTSSCSTTVTLSAASCTGIRADAQGTWGANATAYNASGYMTTNWAAAFPSPNYLTIGCGTRLMRFTTAAAVITTLPTYGTQSLLPTGTTINPGASVANSLVGQIVALRINVRMDEMLPAFSSSSVLLKNMIVASGTFAGMTVQTLLNTAEQTIGGCATTYTLSSLSSALTSINNGYQGGTMNSGYLTCPPAGMQLEGGGEGVFVLDDGFRMIAFPNPLTTSTTIRLAGLDVHERLTVDVLDVTGKVVAPLYDGAVPEDGSKQVDWTVGGSAAGFYFYRVVNGERSVTEKLIVQQ